MPAAEHARIVASAKKAGLRPGTDRFDAYVYSTLNKIKKRRKAKRARAVAARR